MMMMMTPTPFKSRPNSVSSHSSVDKENGTSWENPESLLGLGDDGAGSISGFGGYGADVVDGNANNGPGTPRGRIEKSSYTSMAAVPMTRPAKPMAVNSPPLTRASRPAKSSLATPEVDAQKRRSASPRDYVYTFKMDQPRPTSPSSPSPLSSPTLLSMQPSTSTSLMLPRSPRPRKSLTDDSYHDLGISVCVCMCVLEKSLFDKMRKKNLNHPICFTFFHSSGCPQNATYKR